MTSLDRARIHTFLDRLIAKSQPYDRREQPRGSWYGPSGVWPSPTDYVRLDREADK